MARPKSMAILSKPEYRNQWVALTDDEKKVVGYGYTIAEARQQSKKNGVEDPIFAKVPKKAVSYVI